MKATKYIVKAYMGYKYGWQEIKEFDDFTVADNWLCDYVRTNRYMMADFTIIRR